MYAGGGSKMFQGRSIDEGYWGREGEFLLFLRVLKNFRQFLQGLNLVCRDLFILLHFIVDGCCEITGHALRCIVWIFDREGAILWKKIIFSGDTFFTCS